MARDTYTKAASIACLKWMIPSGKLTLVGEREGQMVRVVPHIFREEILADRFEWAIIGVKKDAPIDRIREKQAEFSKFRMGVLQPSQPKGSAQKADSAEEAEASGGATQKKRDRRRDDRPHLPDLARVLYQPWLFHGTPMWAKLQGR